MRNDEIGVARRLPFVSNDVEVERSRPPPHLARPPRLVLDSLQLGEQLAWRQLRLERDHLIEIRALLYRADRCRLLDRGGGDHSRAWDGSERLPSAREMQVAVTEVGAERDVRHVARHYRASSSRLCLTTTSAYASGPGIATCG